MSNYKRNNNKRKKSDNKGNNNRCDSNTNNTLATCDTNNIGKKDSRGFSKSTGNDASWYNTLPELVRDAANFPFSRPLGVQYIPRSDASVSVDSSYGVKSIPGIMNIVWYPTIGNSDNSNSPINIVAREVYSFVRHANSGHSNYDAPDLMLYFMAMDSLYSMYSEAVRVYGSMMLYNANNRYYPKALIECMGWNFENVQSNMAQLRWAINQFAYKLGSLAVPANMSYFTRHIWLNSGIYMDSNSNKAQTYVFTQGAFYKYNPTVESGFKSRLVFEKRNASKMTVSNWISTMNSYIDPILASEDFNIMSGDVLRAFGQENLFTVAPIAEDYVVLPTYSQEVLSQIQNLTIMGYPDTTVSTGSGDFANIVQRINSSTWDPGLYQELTFTTLETVNKPKSALAQSQIATTMEKLISMLSDSPTADEVMVATRLTNICDIYGVEERVQQSNKYYRGTSGVSSNHTYSTEVVAEIRIAYMGANGSLGITHFEEPAIVFEPSSESNLLGELAIAKKIIQLEAFDWHPTIPLMGCNYTLNGNDKPRWMGYLQETNNFTIMNIEDLTRLHETALISEFSVPQIASLARKPFRSN